MEAGRHRTRNITFTLSLYLQIGIHTGPICMSILVTGGCGYIGSHMVHELADAGEQVVVLDNLSTGFRKASPKGVPLYVGDVGDIGLVSALIGTHAIKSIIHFSASIVVPD